jgi:hypothetical protein
MTETEILSAWPDLERAGALVRRRHRARTRAAAGRLLTFPPAGRRKRKSEENRAGPEFPIGAPGPKMVPFGLLFDLESLPG